MKPSRFLQLASLSAALIAGAANATLVGDTINASGIGLGPATATIGAGPEFNFVGIETFDFGASTLTINGPSQGSHGWSDFLNFTFSGFDEVITGLSIASNSGFSGDPLSNFSFTANSITLHWGIGQADKDAVLVFNIDTQQVPEPETLPLVGLGLLGVFAARRKARKQ